MMRYSIEPRARKYVKGCGFLSFVRKCRKQLLDKGLDALKTTSTKIFHKATKATDEFLGNKITDVVTKSNDNKIVKPDENPRNFEEIIITPAKREAILHELRQVLYKWNTIKYLSY